MVSDLKLEIREKEDLIKDLEREKEALKAKY